MKYADAGVNIDAGDAASRAAYMAAKSTFGARKNMIGQPYVLDEGYAGALDMGNFLLVQNDDGTGTKAEIAERVGDYSTLGHDLCAMVADDAVCVGAEVISITNTFDVPSVNPEQLGALAESLAEACREQKIVIPGGEIAEMGNAVNKLVWNATAVGVVKKERYITGYDVKAGDAIIALRGRVLRSNGVSLARKICEKHLGENWHNAPFDDEKTWGQVLLTPSKIYHRVLHDALLGGFEGNLKHTLKALCHVTGGGVPGNLPRVLPEGMGADLPHLHAPHAALQQLVEMGDVADAEAYRTWHSGSAMLLVCKASAAEKICKTLNEVDGELDAQVAGAIINEPIIALKSGYSGTILTYPIA